MKKKKQKKIRREKFLLTFKPNDYKALFYQLSISIRIKVASLLDTLYYYNYLSLYIQIYWTIAEFNNFSFVTKLFPLVRVLSKFNKKNYM